MQGDTATASRSRHKARRDVRTVLREIRTMRKGKQRRLKSMENIRALLADTIRALEATSALSDPETAKLVINGARVLGELVRGAKIEDRLDKVEQMLANATAPQIDSGPDFFKLSESAAVIPVISPPPGEAL